jgi:hypothetical protein
MDTTTAAIVGFPTKGQVVKIKHVGNGLSYCLSLDADAKPSAHAGCFTVTGYRVKTDPLYGNVLHGQRRAVFCTTHTSVEVVG